MGFFVGGLAALVVILLAARLFVNADPRAIIRFLRYTVGGVLIAIGAVMALAGRWVLGIGAVAFGVSAIATGRLGPLDLGGGARTQGTGSTVRTALLEMKLDHDTGDMDGRVLSGEQAGRMLSELSDDDVFGMFRAVGDDDPESAALLAAYLDRRVPGWREDFQGDATAGASGASEAGPMTHEQAYEILGLAPGASKADIRSAHRRLMKRVHPDQGGSTFLAAKINQAKDLLLGGHR